MYSLLGLHRVQAKWEKNNLPTHYKAAAHLPLGAAKWTACPCVYLLRGAQPRIQRRDVFFEGGGLLRRGAGGEWPGSLLLNNIQNKQKRSMKTTDTSSPPLSRLPPSQELHVFCGISQILTVALFFTRSDPHSADGNQAPAVE